MPKFSMPKIEKPKIAKITHRKKGDRSLTRGDKNREKRNANHTCQKCKKKFPAYLLDVHHKKSVASHKTKGMVDVGYIEFYYGRKKKNAYDRSNNLMVLCPICHRNVHKEESIKRKEKKKSAIKKQQKNNLLNIKIPNYNLGI